MSSSVSEDVPLKDAGCHQNQTQEIEMVPTSFSHDEVLHCASPSSTWLSPGGSQTFENSLGSVDQSSSSDVAIAEEIVNSLEMTTSQQTLDDVSMMTSCGTISSLSERMSDVAYQECQSNDGIPSGSLLESSTTSLSGKNEGALLQENLEVLEASAPIVPHQHDIEVQNIAPFFIGETYSKTENDRMTDETVTQLSCDVKDCSKAQEEGPSVKEAIDESQATSDVSAKEDQAESSIPKVPFKGKGVGKSSGGKIRDDPHQLSSRIYCPYNSGNMKYSTDDDQSDVHMIPEIQEQKSPDCGAILHEHSGKTDFTQRASSTKVTFNESIEQSSAKEADLTCETESTPAAHMAPEAVVMSSDSSEQQGPSWHGSENSGEFF